MQPVGTPANRLLCPDRCLRAPVATYDRSFAIHVCGVRESHCAYRGPVFVLDAAGRHFECRKAGEVG
jgi:hypothetical protein